MAATVITRVVAFQITGKENAFFSERIRRPKQLAGNSRRAHRILSRVIEYVANEFLQDLVPPGPSNSRLQAVELLMALDRRVYSESEKVPTFIERCSWFLRSPRKPVVMKIL
jgi:hypothetical protein